MSPETEAMWKTLSKLAAETRQLHIAERSTGQQHACREILKLAFSNGAPFLEHVTFSISLLEKLIWENKENHPELNTLRGNYYQWLTETGQDEKAGEVKESEGDFQAAINLYLKAGLPAKAARLAISRPEISSSTETVSRIAASLIKGEFCSLKAIEAAIAARQWKKAVHILELQEDASAEKFYVKIAQHYASIQDYEVAEQLFVKGGHIKDAVDMYTAAGRWEEAHKVSQETLKE
ncbi:hypothetical protein GOODEAATRI_004899 [Goodea atripinnis]|uniref:Uncharacterized protein n=1 Tax=Goodea atripinnis TaxID=208336 RepID=A0ABV0MH33_9TELE